MRTQRTRAFRLRQQEKQAVPDELSCRFVARDDEADECIDELRVVKWLFAARSVEQVADEVLPGDFLRSLMSWRKSCCSCTRRAYSTCSSSDSGELTSMDVQSLNFFVAAMSSLGTPIRWSATSSGSG